MRKRTVVMEWRDRRRSRLWSKELRNCADRLFWSQDGIRIRILAAGRAAIQGASWEYVESSKQSWTN